MSEQSFEETSAAAAYQRVSDELSAMPAEQLLRVNTDIARAASKVLGVVPRVRDLLPRMEQLPGLRIDRVRNLETYALAAWYAYACAWDIKKRSVTRDLIAKAKPLRSKLVMAATVFADGGFVDAAMVNKIRSGQGKLDRARDMIALSALLSAAWPRIAATTLVTREDLRQASVLGEQLVQALAHGEREILEQRRAMADRSARAFTLLCQVYDSLQRALVYLRWEEGDAYKIAPSLFDNGGGRRKAVERLDETPSTASEVSLVQPESSEPS